MSRDTFKVDTRAISAEYNRMSAVGRALAMLDLQQQLTDDAHLGDDVVQDWVWLEAGAVELRARLNILSAIIEREQTITHTPITPQGGALNIPAL